MNVKDLMEQEDLGEVGVNSSEGSNDIGGHPVRERLSIFKVPSIDKSIEEFMLLTDESIANLRVQAPVRFDLQGFVKYFFKNRKKKEVADEQYIYWKN